MKIIVWDTETTGLPIQNSRKGFLKPENYKCYDSARLVEISMFFYENEILQYKINYIIRPDNFEIKNSHIHGITQENALENGIDIKFVLTKVYDMMKDCDKLVAHNIQFDKNILLAEAYRYNHMELIQCIEEKEKVCTMLLGQKKLNLKKRPKLCELYSILFQKEPDVELHRASNDVMLCAECYFKL
tara:strand:+ start:733 stop:1293 length:561 start_codon:yes stop_codon:yes gene_type:complete